MQIEKVKVCNPIEILVDTLVKKGFEIVQSEVSDYHFHQLYFKLQGKYTDELEQIHMDKIKKIDDTTFSCSCHWSIVELIYK